MGYGYGPIPNGIQKNVAAPGGTASTTLVMAGLAAAITPAVIGRVLLIVSGAAASDTTNDGVRVQLSFGTNSAPTNGAALTGTQTGSIWVESQDLLGADKMGFCLQSLVLTMLVGTTYWLDVAFSALTAGTASI